jgi:hypothetical protein
LKVPGGTVFSWNRFIEIGHVLALKLSGINLKELPDLSKLNEYA